MLRIISENSIQKEHVFQCSVLLSGVGVFCKIKIDASVAKEFSAFQGLGDFLVASNVPLHKICSYCMIFENDILE